MSRPEKKQRYQSTVSELQETTNVRVFGFTNYRDGYRSAPTPFAPFIILRAKQSNAGDPHPARQWLAFATAVYRCNPATEAVLMLDASQVGPQAETEELAAGPMTLGNLCRPVVKNIVRLNPRRAVLVGAGPTAWHLLKMLTVNFNGADEYVEGLLLLLPGDPPAEIRQTMRKRAVEAASTGAALHRFRVVVVAASTAAFTEEAWADLHRVFDVRCGATQAGEPLFETATAFAHSAFDCLVASSEQSDTAAGASASGSAVQVTSANRESAITTYQIAIVRSPYSKQLEQHAERADLEAPVAASVTVGGIAGSGKPAAAAAASSGDDEGDDAESDEDDAPDDDVSAAIVGRRQQQKGASSSSAPARQAASVHPSDFINAGECDIAFHGVVMAGGGSIGNSQGVFGFHPEAATEAAAALMPHVGRPVSLTATLSFDDGHACLRNVRDVAPLPGTRTKHGWMLCPADAVPPVNHSALRRSFGCVVIRGRKIALVRSLEGAFDGMRFPAAPLASPLTAVECAVRATARLLDVSPDNFTIRPELGTVVVPQPHEHGVLTLFIATASFRPPGGAARDEIEEDPIPDDPYDWLTAAQARDVLRSPAERDAVDDLVRIVARAHQAGTFVAPIAGLGTFGDAGVRPNTSVAFVLAPAAASIAETADLCRAMVAAASNAKAGSSSGTSERREVHVLEPASTACPSKRRKATVAAVAELLAGKRDVTVLVPVSPAADLDLVLYELAPAVTAKLWAPTRLVAVVHADRVPCEPSSTAPQPSSLAGATLASATFAALEQCDVAVYLAPGGGSAATTSSARGWSEPSFWACVRGLNRGATVAVGLESVVSHVDPQHQSESAGDMLRAEAAGAAGGSTVAVLQFDRSGPTTVPLCTARVESSLLAGGGGDAVLKRCGVLHLSGHVWLATRPHHQALLTAIAGRAAVRKGDRWANSPGHSLRVVVGAPAQDELAECVRGVEALLADLSCRNRAETAADTDGLAWADSEDDEE